MRYCKVTCYVEGEAVVEPSVPVWSLPFLRWVCRMLGASMHVGAIEESKTDALRRRKD